jgi:hypothetical protein
MVINTYMKSNRLLLNLFILFFPCYVSAQNVGIGTSTPTRGKLEVVGVAGAGATTAIFGGHTTGISLQCNWPTIGFNQYRDVVTPGSQGKYIANGYSAIQYFDPTNGNMVFDFFQSGTANEFTSVATTGIVLERTGKMNVSNGVHLNLLKISSDKTGAGNNLLPIGMASVQGTGSKQGGTSNITTAFVTDHYVIQLNEGVTGTIPVITVLAGANTGSRIATCINGSPTELWVYIWTGTGVLTQAGFNIVVYKP